MARVWSLQSSFNRGELDPRLVGRKDLQAYYAGARQAKNVVTLVQGGIRRRNGTEFIAEDDDGRIFNFSFSTEVNYCLLFTNLQCEVFKDGVSQTTFVTPYTLAQVKEIDYIQSADTALLFHADVQPREISRTSDVSWSISAITFSNTPQYDFNDASSPTPVSEVQDVQFGTTNEGDLYKLGLNGVLTDEIAYASPGATGATTNENNIRDALLALRNTANDGISVSQTGTGPDVYRVTFSGNSADDWDLLTGVPISVKNSSFQISTVEIAAGTSRAEDVWSNARGWPQNAVFHEARLWLGGSTFRPSTIWGSKVNFFFDFGDGKARDDEGIDVTLDTDQVNAITGMFSNRTLQVFTSGGEFSVNASPITPTNIAVLPQTNFGTKKVRPVTIDGLTLFVQRTGKAVRNFFFVDESKAYSSSSVSVLASHLINDPVELAVSRGTSAVDANYAYILNSDGSLSVYNSLAAEDVQGFTNWVTDGEVMSVTVVDDLLYMYVKRTIGGVDTYFLEREDPTLTTDSSASATSTDTLTGLSHLNGETIEVIADGAYQGEFVVSGGQVTIDRTADLITGGINFIPIVESMPLNIPLQNGPNSALPKRIVRAGLELFESNGVLVNGERIADKTMGVDVFDPPSPQTGLERIFLQGWDVESTLTITQDEPVPMTVLAAYLEVSV
jgi:hypothetical protein